MEPGTRVRTRELPAFTFDERTQLEYSTGTVVERPREARFSTLVEVKMDKELFTPFYEDEVVSFRPAELEVI